MSEQAIDLPRPLYLRNRALSRLNGQNAQGTLGMSASAALGVLYQLASSPESAMAAIALLHELQVHQVELDLQDEELKSSRAELEASFSRQVELYDHAPVACLAVNHDTVIGAANLTGARLLGVERAALPGRRLTGFLAPASRFALDSLVARVGGGAARVCGALQLVAGDGTPHTVNAAITADPGSGGLLIALMESS